MDDSRFFPSGSLSGEASLITLFNTAAASNSTLHIQSQLMSTTMPPSDPYVAL